MADPVVFDTATPRFALPLLFAAQAQKEFFVNEAASRTDALLHCAIEGTANAPPAAPQPGETWLIGTAPSGAWTGQAGRIASFQGGSWVFQAPRDGIQVLSRQTGQRFDYRGGWRKAVRPANPLGGTTIDAEVRATLVNLLETLATAGIFATS